MELRKLYSAERIAKEVARLAKEIDVDYAGKKLRLLVVLRGAFIFAADLVRQLHLPVQVDFITAASYAGMESTGSVVIDKAADLLCLSGQHVLIVEDILDTGLTLASILQTVGEKKPLSLRVCTLINKTARHRPTEPPHYVGIECSGGFLVGYGLDINGNMRELPDIYEVLDPGSGGL